MQLHIFLVISQASILLVQKLFDFLFTSSPHTLGFSNFSYYYLINLQVTGHSTEKVLLGAVLPVVHTSIWNIVLVLVNVCGSFLLPYAAHIESNLVHGVTELSLELKK